MNCNSAAAPLRFEIPEAAKILRCSRGHIYNRIRDGAIKAQKDGARRYISAVELQRYVAACDDQQSAA